MWDRCHWRFLYYMKENVESLSQYIDTKENGAAIKEFFAAMNTDDHIYDFATKCGSWDWAGIGIMLVCCMFMV